MGHRPSPPGVAVSWCGAFPGRGSTCAMHSPQQTYSGLRQPTFAPFTSDAASSARGVFPGRVSRYGCLGGCAGRWADLAPCFVAQSPARPADHHGRPPTAHPSRRRNGCRWTADTGTQGGGWVVYVKAGRRPKTRLFFSIQQQIAEGSECRQCSKWTSSGASRELTQGFYSAKGARVKVSSYETGRRNLRPAGGIGGRR
jgi:hypothetical protein